MTQHNGNRGASGGKAAPPQKGHLDTKPEFYDSVTETGRWKYEKLLGCGSYGRVWKVVDMLHPDKPFRALKVCRYRHGSPQVFQLHREAQYSLRYIHNQLCDTYDHEYSMLFVKYLEDCTSFRDNTELEDTLLQHNKKAAWKKSELAPSKQTTCDYVVMEYCDGRPLRWLLRKVGPTVKEARQILMEAASALDYLSRFEPALIHRDFRSANMLWMKAGQGPCNYRLKVLDMGLMLPYTVKMCDDIGVANSISPTQYNYWVPKEAMEKTGGRMLNFAFGRSSAFDIFSLGMLAYEIACPERPVDFRLQVTDKRDPCHRKTLAFWCALGMNKKVLASMVHESWSCRPDPRRVYAALTANPKILVNFNERMGKDHVATCQFIGCMGSIVAGQEKLAKALKIITAWVVHSMASVGLTIKQLAHLAFRERNHACIKPDLVLEAFEQLTKQLAVKCGMDSTKAHLCSELENVNKQFGALVVETKDVGRCLTDEQEEHFQSKKNLIIAALDNMFPHMARDTQETTRHACPGKPGVAPTQYGRTQINVSQCVPPLLPDHGPAVTNQDIVTPARATVRGAGDNVVPREKPRARMIEDTTPPKAAKCRMFVDDKREQKNSFEPRIPSLSVNAVGSTSKIPLGAPADDNEQRDVSAKTEGYEQQVPAQDGRRQHEEDVTEKAPRTEHVDRIAAKVTCAPRSKLPPLKGLTDKVARKTGNTEATIHDTGPPPSKKRVQQDMGCEIVTQGEPFGPKKRGRIEVTPDTHVGYTPNGSSIYPVVRKETSYSTTSNASCTGVGGRALMETDAPVDKTEDTAAQGKARGDSVLHSSNTPASCATMALGSTQCAVGTTENMDNAQVGNRVKSHISSKTSANWLENSEDAHVCVGEEETHANMPNAVERAVMRQLQKALRFSRRVERDMLRKRRRIDRGEGISAQKDAALRGSTQLSGENGCQEKNDDRREEKYIGLVAQSKDLQRTHRAENAVNDAVPKHSKTLTMRLLMQCNYEEHEQDAGPPRSSHI
eukprot:GEMP01002042.1.p1 GENE.GEMP01002042.1~~GEMP01002042.1.p1  ORF type:complete len:1011 (+),score=217.91 GEMP01002042.1:307-3339(+)